MFRAFLNQYLVYIAIAAVLVAGASGWKVRDWQCKADGAKLMERAAAERARMQEVIDEQSAAYEEDRGVASAVATTRERSIREVFVSVPAPAGSCAPPPVISSVLMDAVEDANRAVAGAPRQPSRAVSAAGPAADPPTGP